MDIEEQRKREKLNRLMIEERDLQAKWYERISGAKPFLAGEKDRLDRQWNQVVSQVDKLQGELAIA